jgi:Flp pilus assembly protein protease CpaA
MRLRDFSGKVIFWRKCEPTPQPAREPITVPYGLAIACGCVVALFTG